MVQKYRELTFAAVFLGIIQGIILNLAFVYASLKLGFSIGGSTVAAIMGYALLKGVLGKGTSIENNINQTVASGINTVGTGVVFTLPAIFLLQASGDISVDFSLIPFTLAGIAGAFLGVVVIVPLRKQMIELDRLRFPSGVAVTTIIRSGSDGDYNKAKLLGIGFAISAIWKLIMVTGLIDVPGLIEHEEFYFGFGIIPAYMTPVLYLSLMNVAAGMLAGKGGLSYLFGGLVAWWIISPFTVFMNWVPGSTNAEYSDFIYGNMLRPLGIGLLIGGAIVGTFMCFPAIKSAIRSLANVAAQSKNGGEVTRDEMPFAVLVVGAICSVIMFFAATYMMDGVTLPQAIATAVIVPIWLALAALIVAQATGMTDISPMSGMALITVTLMMFILNKNVATSVVIAGAVCVAIGQGADMMQDLKTGYMLGGTPFKQQIVQFCVTWIGVVVATFAVYVLWKGGPNGMNGFGAGTSLPAPQASVMVGIIKGLKSGNIPLDKYVTGGIIGGVLALAPWSGLAIMIGLAMYLPFSITLGYGLGCLLQMFLEKKKGKPFCEHKLVPFAAGLIIGEAITGIGHAAFEIFSK